MPEISIIIVTLQNRDEIEFLNQLNEFTDEKVEVIIRNDKGICEARNSGIKEATTDKIIFLDDDAYPCEEYVSRAQENLEKHNIVAGRVIDTGHPWVGKTVSHYDQGDQRKVTNELVGCNMAFRKDVFKTIGMFDEDIQWGHDEKELIDRALAEYEILYDPEMAVEHPYASDIADYWKKQYRLGVADVWYWKKRKNSVGQEILTSSLSPKEYIDYSIRGTLVKIPGGVAKTYGRLRGYQRLRNGSDIFG